MDDRSVTTRPFHKLAFHLALALGLLAGSGCGRNGGGDAEREAELAPAVEALPARRGTLPLEERLNGVVKADNQVAVQAEIEAPIVEVLARNGEAVERGQALVRLDGDELRDQLRQAEAAVRLAEATAQEARARVAEVEARVVRTRRLAAEQLVSQLELETQEAQLAAARAGAGRAAAQVEQARATVQERRSALDETVVRAPVAGRVGQRNAEVGMLAGPDDVLFLLGDLQDLIVEVPLTEKMLGRLRPGQPVRIGSPALGRETVAATLSRISPFLAAASFSTTGEIDVANGRGPAHPRHVRHRGRALRRERAGDAGAGERPVGGPARPAPAGCSWWTARAWPRAHRPPPTSPRGAAGRVPAGRGAGRGAGRRGGRRASSRASGW